MVCHCELPYFVPGACKSCYRGKGIDSKNYWAPFMSPVKTKRIIEIYDSDGKLIERIVEEEQ